MKGKSICVVNDLTLDEQKLVYTTAAAIKKSISSGELPIPAVKGSAYMMFLEDSTRTKESFRNASETLAFRTNMFDSGHSSMNKFETINDTVRMLCGYTPSLESVFMIRSKIEGVCKSLSESMAVYATKAGISRPIFVNAGDGRHEHPTQEFLDEFSFLEQMKDDTSRVHIALVGDLLLGRTIHSKADGLCVFEKVVVDLVAPEELQLPATYLEKMEKNGFEINFFDSLDEYLSGGHSVAPILYFTRLQLERMPASMLSQVDRLRKSTSLTMAMLHKLPTDSKIYHPLPRHGEFPEIPFAVDHTPFNGYDEQSRNGFFVRTALLGLLTGAIPSESSETHPMKHFKPNIFESISVPPPAEVYPLISPHEAWLELEFPGGFEIRMMRGLIAKFQKISGMDNSDGFCHAKGLIARFSFPDSFLKTEHFSLWIFAFFASFNPKLIQFDGETMKAAVAAFHPNHRIVLPKMCCSNSACVSHPDAKQRDVPPAFEPSKIAQNKFTCVFCETETLGHDMW